VFFGLGTFTGISIGFGIHIGVLAGRPRKLSDETGAVKRRETIAGPTGLWLFVPAGPVIANGNQTPFFRQPRAKRGVTYEVPTKLGGSAAEPHAPSGRGVCLIERA
jgi:hypothetical protein